MILAAGNHDILEDFPRPAEVDDHCAFRNKKGNRDTALGGRLERVRFARLFVIAGTARRFNRSCVRGKLTDNEESKRNDQTGSCRGID